MGLLLFWNQNTCGQLNPVRVRLASGASIASGGLESLFRPGSVGAVGSACRLEYRLVHPSWTTKNCSATVQNELAIQQLENFWYWYALCCRTSSNTMRGLHRLHKWSTTRTFWQLSGQKTMECV